MKTDQTNIEWADYTFNPWRGCTKVSTGCANCYAETLSKRNPKVLGEWGAGKPRVRASEAMWRSPLKWNEDAGKAQQWAANERPRVFCASLADWLDDEVPIEWLTNLLETIHSTPNLDWLLLTKRPQNWQSRLEAAHRFAWDHGDSERHDEVMNWLGAWAHAHVPPDNIWIGTSVENQSAADERIPLLLTIPAKVRFLSCEPLLGSVDLHSPHIKVETWRVGESFDGPAPLSGIHWVIAGGESGPKARPMHPDWARSLRDQCKAAGVPFLFKQWGEWGDTAPPAPARCTTEQREILPDGTRLGCRTRLDCPTVWRVGKKAAGRVLDGRTHDDFPPSIAGLPQR